MAEWYYVYTPFYGPVTGLDYYCGGGPHTLVTPGFANPRDVGGGSGGYQLYFRGSSNVRSIYVVNRPGIACASPAIGAPYDDVVQVNLYNQLGGGANGGYIGSVSYAHVQWPIANGPYNTNSGPIGWVPSGCPNLYYDPNTGQLVNCYTYCGCPCYQGAHTHMERYLGQVNTSLQCWTPYVNPSYDWIYAWYA